MMRTAVLAFALTGSLAGGLAGQRLPLPQDAGAAYAAVLQALPLDLAGREVLVDPRASLSFMDNAAPVDVWEKHLHSTASDPAVLALDHRVQDMSWCAETVERSRCLGSTRQLHVTFSAPGMLGGFDVVVEATFVTRTSDERGAFLIQTWRYAFSRRDGGLTLQDRELLASGHGRVGGGRP
ncbi:MAG TPA: hypothetical protein VK929_06185 [Longimicrobiales bacterium]|nr:hypothetical protein [Longimicrobiales bacterium]